AQLRARIGDRLASRESIDAARAHVQRAEEGASSKAAVALAALCNDAESLLVYTADPEARRAPAIALPFSDLEHHWKQLRDLQGKVVTKSSGPELRAAIENDLKTRAADDSFNASAELGRRLDDVKKRIGDGLGSADVRRAARKDLDEIEGGRRALLAVFPDATKEIEAAAPTKPCGELRDRLDQADRNDVPAGAALTVDQARSKLRQYEPKFTSTGAS